MPVLKGTPASAEDPICRTRLNEAGGRVHAPAVPAASAAVAQDLEQPTIVVDADRRLVTAGKAVVSRKELVRPEPTASVTASLVDSMLGRKRNDGGNKKRFVGMNGESGSGSGSGSGCKDAAMLNRTSCHAVANQPKCTERQTPTTHSARRPWHLVCARPLEP